MFAEAFISIPSKNQVNYKESTLFTASVAISGFIGMSLLQEA
jgi:hypothetical protein